MCLLSGNLLYNYIYEKRPGKLGTDMPRGVLPIVTTRQLVSLSGIENTGWEKRGTVLRLRPSGLLVSTCKTNQKIEG